MYFGIKFNATGINVIFSNIWQNNDWHLLMFQHIISYMYTTYEHDEWYQFPFYNHGHGFLNFKQYSVLSIQTFTVSFTIENVTKGLPHNDLWCNVY